MLLVMKKVMDNTKKWRNIIKRRKLDNYINKALNQGWGIFWYFTYDSHCMYKLFVKSLLTGRAVFVVWHPVVIKRVWVLNQKVNKLEKTWKNLNKVEQLFQNLNKTTLQSQLWRNMQRLGRFGVRFSTFYPRAIFFWSSLYSRSLKIVNECLKKTFTNCFTGTLATTKYYQKDLKMVWLAR